MKDLVGLILAGGFSKRMGQLKPLMPFGQERVIEIQLQAMKDAGFSQIVVVVGHEAEKVRKAVGEWQTRKAQDIRCDIVENCHYEKGMFSSIQTGVSYIKESGAVGFQGIALLPVDYPLVKSEDFLTLYKEWKNTPAWLAVSCYRGKKGHPVILPLDAWDSILWGLNPKGLKSVTNEYEETGRMIRVESENEGVVLDMDTPSDYRSLQNFQGRAWEDALNLYDGTLFLLRHGATKLHKEKMFLGQTDVVLSEIGEEQARRVTNRLVGWQPKNPVILTSNLWRAKATARTVRDDMRKTGKFRPPLYEEDCFREIDLGEWDGQPISWVKSCWPEGYERRGEDLLGYKGHGGESYYDLRYRVMKSLCSYMERFSNRDIILVAHKGVIETIWTTAMGIPMEEKHRLKLEKGDMMILPLGKG